MFTRARLLPYHLFLLLGALLLTGCAEFQTYCCNRARDLGDVFVVGGGTGGLIMFGPGGGLEAGLKVTEGANVVVGASQMREFEIRGRRLVRFEEKSLGFPFATILTGLTPVEMEPTVAWRTGKHRAWLHCNLRRYLTSFTPRYKQSTGIQLPPTLSEATVTSRVGTSNYEGLNSWWFITPWLDSTSPLIDKFNIEASATLLFFSARLGLNTGQLADFITGLFGADIAKDDPPMPK